MKITYIITAYFSAILLFIASCESPDLAGNMETGVNRGKGLLNFTINVPGNPKSYYASKVGPYNDGDTIYVKIPSPPDNPTEVTNVNPTASLANNYIANPAIPSIADFTKPLTVTVYDPSGGKSVYYVKLVLIPPKITITEMWFKTALSLPIDGPPDGIDALAVSGNNLLLIDGDDILAQTGKLKVYNKMTGAFVKNIPLPRSFVRQVASDDAGHFIITRYNIYGAGFEVYYYDNIDATPKLILNSIDGECPANTGKKVTVTGNLKQGKAYIYATVCNVYGFEKGDADYCIWEFNDGVPVSTTPVIRRFSSGTWYNAKVQRETTDPNSNSFVFYNNEDGYTYPEPANHPKAGSFFASGPAGTEKLNNSNIKHRIEDFNVFTVHGERFLAMMQQNYFPWNAFMSGKLFNITNLSDMQKADGDNGFSDFMLLETPLEGYHGFYNTYAFGAVASSVEGDVAYIYIYYPSNRGQAGNAELQALKLTYYPQ